MRQSQEFRPVDFHATPAFARLRRMAGDPYDLSLPGALTPERVEALRASSCGWDLLYATQRVTAEVMGVLGELSEETFARLQFQQLMAGEVMNRIEGQESENRQALHFASRDLFPDLPTPFGNSANSAAQPAQANARRELEKLRAFMERVEAGELTNARGEPFTDLVNVGIGGSDLGPRALYLALLPEQKGGRRVHFISTLDPEDAAQVLGGLELSRTLVNVVSKSGSTLETLTNETLAREAFRRAKLEPRHHFLCVTGEGSPMDNPEE